MIVCGVKRLKFTNAALPNQALGYALRLKNAEFRKFIQILTKNDIYVVESAMYARGFGYYIDNAFGGEAPIAHMINPDGVVNGPEFFFNSMGHGIQLVMKLVENDSSYDEDHKAHLAIMGVDRCVVNKNGEIDESVLEAVKDRLTRLMFE